jgi:hypothetical protein
MVAEICEFGVRVDVRVSDTAAKICELEASVFDGIAEPRITMLVAIELEDMVVAVSPR